MLFSLEICFRLLPLNNNLVVQVPYKKGIWLFIFHKLIGSNILQYLPEDPSTVGMQGEIWYI